MKKIPIIICKTEFHQPKDRYKDTSKEERAEKLDNVICPKCKYQNHKVFVIKYGKCNLCGSTLDSKYFKKTLLKKLKEKKHE